MGSVRVLALEGFSSVVALTGWGLSISTPNQKRLDLRILRFRYGYGAEHVLEMDVVLADGTIAHVYPNR